MVVMVIDPADNQIVALRQQYRSKTDRRQQHSFSQHY
jgi:hypothetical protein